MRPETLPPRKRAKRFIALLAVGLVGGYVITVGMVPAILGHIGDRGRLQWLPSIPYAVSLLEAYEWPARQLSRVRVFHAVFELSASFWWSSIDPPDTTP